jgi:hypothetical protein
VHNNWQECSDNFVYEMMNTLVNHLLSPFILMAFQEGVVRLFNTGTAVPA